MSHLAKTVLMVRPNAFGFNEETAATNAFMHSGGAGDPMAEFDALAAALQAAGIGLIARDGPKDAPDAVFPNNWISTHDDGSVVIYPMAHSSRRRERTLLETLRIHPEKLVDLTQWEGEARYLEGTGSLVLDRANRIAFASLSPRTTEDAVLRWCERFDYWPILFEANDRNGSPIYHTNVLLSVGTDWAVFCREACLSPNKVLAELKVLGKQVIEIDFDRMESFCGNILELDGVIAASASAWNAFSANEQTILSKGRAPVVADISTIESIGGGSVRCMLAEWFL